MGCKSLADGSAIGFGVMIFANNFVMVLLTTGFFVFSNAMLRPGVSSLISKRTEHGQGTAMGLNNSYMSLGRIVGPLWAGSALDVNLILPYASAAVVSLISFGASLYCLSSRHPAKEVLAAEEV